MPRLAATNTGQRRTSHSDTIDSCRRLLQLAVKFGQEAAMERAAADIASAIDHCCPSHFDPAGVPTPPGVCPPVACDALHLALERMLFSPHRATRVVRLILSLLTLPPPSLIPRFPRSLHREALNAQRLDPSVLVNALATQTTDDDPPSLPYSPHAPSQPIVLVFSDDVADSVPGVLLDAPGAAHVHLHAPAAYTTPVAFCMAVAEALPRCTALQDLAVRGTAPRDAADPTAENLLPVFQAETFASDVCNFILPTLSPSRPLLSLTLSHCSLHQKNAPALSAALANCTALHTLDLSHNELPAHALLDGDAGTSPLSRMPYLAAFSLAHNVQQDLSATAALLFSLPTPSMLSLDLSFCLPSALTPHAHAGRLDCLAALTSCTALSELHLSGSGALFNDAAAATATLASLSGVRRLGLGHLGASEDGSLCVAVRRLLAAMPLLEHIDCSGTALGGLQDFWEGCVAPREALLLELRAANCQLGSGASGAPCSIDTSRAVGLRVLDLADNSLGVAELCAVVQAVQPLCLDELHVS